MPPPTSASLAAVASQLRQLIRSLVKGGWSIILIDNRGGKRTVVVTLAYGIDGRGGSHISHQKETIMEGHRPLFVN